MYPSRCKTFYTGGKLFLYSGSTLVAQTSFTDALGYGFIGFDSLAAGTYTVKVQMSW